MTSGRAGASSAAIRAALSASDAPAACAAARLEIRQLVTALAAGLPQVDDPHATWADLTADVAVRDLLRDALRIVGGE